MGVNVPNKKTAQQKFAQQKIAQPKFSDNKFAQHNFAKTSVDLNLSYGSKQTKILSRDFLALL